MPTLDWIGKRAVLNHHREIAFHLLEQDTELSTGEVDFGNMLVEGDNLLALKTLLPSMAKRVKCIYIDPLPAAAFRDYERDEQTESDDRQYAPTDKSTSLVGAARERQLDFAAPRR